VDQGLLERTSAGNFQKQKHRFVFVWPEYKPWNRYGILTQVNGYVLVLTHWFGDAP
jgi:hypothetical protein